MADVLNLLSKRQELEGLRRQVRELEAEIGNEHAEWLDRQAEIEQLRSENAELRAALDDQAEQGPVQENGATHVDDWIGNYRNRESYARWWLHHARLPAALQLAFAPVMREFKLFCTWQGKRYRVTGASRFGDVQLSENHSREHGYDHRVNVDECSAWGREP